MKPGSDGRAFSRNFDGEINGKERGFGIEDRRSRIEN
jgi:hypothetical protein